MLNLHAGVIFVFDGDNRPKLKRGKSRRKSPHWLEQLFMSLIEHFGFQSYKAGSVFSVATKKLTTVVFISIGSRRSRSTIGIYELPWSY